MGRILQIHGRDNVAVALSPIQSGQMLQVGEQEAYDRIHEICR